jgi:membrane protease YdiL (CAAX protease family)
MKAFPLPRAALVNRERTDPVAISERANAALFHGPPAYLAATPWTPGWALFTTLAIVAAGIAVALLLVGGIVPLGLPGQGRWLPASQEIAELATLGIWQASTIGLTILASAMPGGRVADVLGLRAPAGTPALYPCALLLMAVLQVTINIVQYYLVPHDTFADLRPFVKFFTGSEWVLALIVVGIGAPLSEELLFRGFLLPALAQSRLGFLGAALVSTGLWTALHAGYSVAGIVEVFVIGLFFSWLLWRTGSLRVPIFCHAVYNSLLVIMLRYVPLPA